MKFIRWLICSNFHLRDLSNWVPATSDYTAFMCRKCGRIETIKTHASTD